MHETAERILSICREALSADGVIQKIFQTYGLVMSAQQYVLIGSTVRSYLSWLKDNGQLETVIEDSMLLWRTL